MYIKGICPSSSPSPLHFKGPAGAAGTRTRTPGAGAFVQAFPSQRRRFKNTESTHPVAARCLARACSESDSETWSQRAPSRKLSEGAWRSVPPWTRQPLLGVVARALHLRQRGHGGVMGRSRAAKQGGVHTLRHGPACRRSAVTAGGSDPWNSPSPTPPPPRPRPGAG